MNLAHISHCYKPVIGGQEVYIENLQKILMAEGIQGDVFQPDRGVTDKDVKPVFRMRVVPRYIHGAEAHLFDFFLNLAHARELEQYDVIIAHYALHAWAQRRHAYKTIVLSHGVEWHQENQTWDDKRREKTAKKCFDLFPHVVNDTHYLRYHGLDAPAGEHCFQEVAPGKWFIPNCVDGARFRPGLGHASLHGRKVILVPRQMVADRGIDLAIKAFKHLSETDAELEMCLLGKRRPGPYIDMIDRLIIDRELTGKVYFAENVPNEEMPAWYNGAVVTLIPTLRREGTSLSALESMSCGVATVSTNVAGLADLPTVQCAPDDIAMAGALQKTLENNAEVGGQQQKIVKATFNMHNWAEAWLRVIGAVASQ
ncbi:MAG: glycosyltransferase family 4 protein [Akkermansiaceae bacterium]|nr:glycosyltransferase family 4 protein [Akkermansiaceae bacterium]